MIRGNNPYVLRFKMAAQSFADVDKKIFVTNFSIILLIMLNFEMASTDCIHDLMTQLNVPSIAVHYDGKGEQF